MMIETAGVVIRRVSAVEGHGEPFDELALSAAKAVEPSSVGAVIAATFSNPMRFPSLAVCVASRLELPSSTPAFDIQMACSAYPYAVYLASKLAADMKKDVLVINGDVQSALVDASDHATGTIFSDAMTASIVGVESGDTSRFGFLSKESAALTCPAAGPIHMDGFAVFSFVATEVSQFLRDFGAEVDAFVPHQAQPYMVRQLARALKLEDRLWTLDERIKNPGSCSIPMTLAAHAGKSGRILIAGFGAGYSASAGLVRFSGC